MSEIHMAFRHMMYLFPKKKEDRIGLWGDRFGIG